MHKPACHPIDNKNYSHYISVKLNAHRWIKINDPVLSIVERLGGADVAKVQHRQTVVDVSAARLIVIKLRRGWLILATILFGK